MINMGIKFDLRRYHDDTRHKLKYLIFINARFSPDFCTDHSFFQLTQESILASVLAKT